MKIIHIFGPKRGPEYEGIWSVEFEEGGNEFERIVRDWLRQEGIYYSEDLTDLT